MANGVSTARGPASRKGRPFKRFALSRKVLDQRRAYAVVLSPPPSLPIASRREVFSAHSDIRRVWLIPKAALANPVSVRAPHPATKQRRLLIWLRRAISSQRLITLTCFPWRHASSRLQPPNVFY